MGNQMDDEKVLTEKSQEPVPIFFLSIDDDQEQNETCQRQVYCSCRELLGDYFDLTTVLDSSRAEQQ